MRRRFFIISTIVIMALMLTSMFSSAQSKDNYYSICNEWDAYYQFHPELKDSSDSEYLSYLRWKYFWKDRVYSSDTMKKGSFNLLHEALDNYQNNSSYYHRASNLYSNWQFIGPTAFNSDLQIAGLISAVYVDTVNDNSMRTIYVGTNSSGIWKTTNGGETWVNITDNSDYSIIGINDICGDPNNTDVIYAATGGSFMNRSHGYGTGILQSRDKGENWRRVFPDPMWQNQNSAMNVYKIKVDPTNSLRIFALVDTMVVRSLNGGRTWQKIFGTTRCIFDAQYSNKNWLYLRDIEMKPDDPSILYIATDHRTPFNTNQAQVWKLWNIDDTILGNIQSQRLDILFPKAGFVSDTLHSIYTQRYAIAVTPAEPEAIFVACTAYPYNLDTNQFTIFKYDNNQWIRKFKKRWSVYNDNFSGCGYFKLELLVSPTTSNVLYAGGDSFDKIINWQQSVRTEYSYGANGYHADTRYATILKGTAPPDTIGSNDVIFAGNDGGISKSVDGIQSWTNLNGSGLYITQIYGIGGANSNPYWIGGGSQDNAFFKLGYQGWLQTGGGDMGDAIINPGNPNYIFSTLWGGGSLTLQKSTNNGLSWASSFSNPTDVYNINSPVCLNPKDPSKVYIATHDLHISNNNGLSFTTKILGDSTILTGQAACAMRVAASDTQRIYIAFNQPWWAYFPTRLYKSTDGGNQWTEITPNIPYGITGIEVSPTNADSIWISLGGFIDQGSSFPNRVMVSSNAGQTWTDYSTGLPNMPVNCLKYKKGSQGGIFAGTDVGVFYIDNTFANSTWVPLNSGLPSCIVTDVEYIDTLDVLRIATYGRGIWETGLYPCTYSENDPLVITSNQTWVVDTIMDRDIDIKAPATLRISCKVKFPTNAKIMVEPNAQLVVDGGVLTNYCSGMWRGIEVWGDTSHNQLPMYQGAAYFINGALVENARIAVTACKKDGNGEIVWSTPGGIIGGSYSTFKNNYKALEFLEYRHNQNCSFSDVKFIDSGYYVDHISHLSDFVSIYKSYGIHFFGCEFTNMNLNSSDKDSRYGRGIYSIDGTYTVDRLCTSLQQPCIQWKPSEFIGLSYGVKALGTMPIFPISITYSKFYKDHKGLYMSGINNVTIHRDTFEFNPVFAYPSNPPDTLYGLYLDNCTGYSVQENELFKQPGLLNHRYIGMIINNSGPEPNEIYRNNISGVTYAILAQKQNRDASGTNGLCIICNNFTSTNNDEVITAPRLYSSICGIATNQGSWTYPAGNVFAQHNSNSYDIYNGVSNSINYYYHRPNSTWEKVEPTNISPYVFKFQTTIPYTDTTCPSKIENGGIDRESLLRQYSFELLQLDSLNTVLNNRVDGGNTAMLTNQIQSSTPPEAIQIHQDLISDSPYLSDTVVKSSILKEDVLPNEMIRDILVANPASSKSDDVLGTINQRIIPMPDSLMADIMASRDTLASMEILQSGITMHGLKKAYAINELIRYYSSDTLSISPKDSIISLLQNDPALESKYKLAFELLDNPDTMMIHNILCSIPISYSLQGNDLLVYQNYRSYFNILMTLKSQHKSVLGLGPVEKSKLMNIVANGTEPLQTYARNVLIANGFINYCEPIIFPDETKSLDVPKSYITSKLISNRYMKVFPNPAKQHFIMEYNLQKRFGENPTVNLSVFTSEGKQLISKKLVKTQDQVLIDTRNFVNGTYICILKVNSEKIDTEKIIIAQ